MNKLDFLLIKLAEECGELTQEASKTALMGVHSTSPYNNEHNIVNLATEFSDVATIYCMICNETGIQFPSNTMVSGEKMRRVNHWYREKCNADRSQMVRASKEATNWE